MTDRDSAPQDPRVSPDDELRQSPPAAAPRRTGPVLRTYLWAEMLVLFFAVPAIIALLIDPGGRAQSLLDTLGLESPIDLPVPPGAIIFPALYTFTAVVLVWLLLDRTFDKRRLWGWPAARRDLPRFAGLFVLAAIGLVWLTDLAQTHLGDMLPEGRRGENLLFGFPRQAHEFWTIVMLAYPLLSAYPQEITHRAFWFHRYGRLFSLPNLPAQEIPGELRAPRSAEFAAIAVNAVAFMWVHVVMWNWVALALTLPGGVLFAATYLRTRSTLAAGLEHALYGNWLFTVGLGWFLFTGSVNAG